MDNVSCALGGQGTTASVGFFISLISIQASQEPLLLGNAVWTVREPTDLVSGASASFCTLFYCPRYFCSSTVSVLHTQLDKGDPCHLYVYVH